MSAPATVFPHDGKRRAGEIEGFTFGSDVSVIVVEYGVAGMGPKLHTHPYAETFIVIEGQATFEVGASGSTPSPARHSSRQPGCRTGSRTPGRDGCFRSTSTAATDS